jgi:hypothetical protein
MRGRGILGPDPGAAVLHSKAQAGSPEVQVAPLSATAPSGGPHSLGSEDAAEAFQSPTQGLPAMLTRRQVRPNRLRNEFVRCLLVILLPVLRLFR